MKKFFVLLFISFFITGAYSEIKFSCNKMPSHPRLYLLKNEEKQVAKYVKKDSFLYDIHNNIIKEATKMLPLPVNKRELIGKRLLSVSRENLRRIFFLSYAYRMTKNTSFSKRAEAEMLSAASFVDWNPSHFLDVAEMTAGLAIGYDWLYDELSENSRKLIRNAIIDKGIKPSYNAKYNWFLKANHNWNQVCNTGLTLGALAIYEDNTEESARIIDRALSTIEKPLSQYAPDGAYPEGYGYWAYGTDFNVLLFSALERIMKIDYNSAPLSIFMKTGAYSQEMITPTLHCFNYSDNLASASFSPVIFWFYSKSKDETLLYQQKRILEKDVDCGYLGNRILPLAVIYAAKSRTSFKNIPIPKRLMWTANGPTPVAVMHSSWNDSYASFLGFKLGSPSVNHAHVDVGSFIFESEGVRWAIDFGSEEYNRLETRKVNLWNTSVTSQRWDVFRYTTKSHNMPCFNDKQQNITASAQINDVIDNENCMSVMSDLTAMYTPQIVAAKRAVSLVDKKYAVIQDNIKTGKFFTKMRWNMLTEASNVTYLSSSLALLEKNDKKLYIKVISKTPIRFYFVDTTPTNTYDSPNKDNMFFGFETDLNVDENQDITVYLMPGNLCENIVVPYKF